MPPSECVVMVVVVLIIAADEQDEEDGAGALGGVNGCGRRMYERCRPGAGTCSSQTSPCGSWIWAVWSRYTTGENWIVLY